MESIHLMEFRITKYVAIHGQRSVFMTFKYVYPSLRYSNGRGFHEKYNAILIEKFFKKKNFL